MSRRRGAGAVGRAERLRGLPGDLRSRGRAVSSRRGAGAVGRAERLHGLPGDLRSRAGNPWRSSLGAASRRLLTTWWARRGKHEEGWPQTLVNAKARGDWRVLH